ncbi:MAG: hypothetical protein ABJP48_06685 [Erythrobacter sp.]
MGGSTLPAGIGNEDGHFEDLDFLRLHSRALGKNGLSRSGVVGLFKPKFDFETCDRMLSDQELARESLLLFERKRRETGAFGWKDPRTCLFLPIYRRAPDIYSLIMFRPCEEVVASLLSRERKVLEERAFPPWRRPQAWLLSGKWETRFRQLRQGYIEAWVRYNTALLDHIEACEPERVMVHDLASFTANWGQIAGTLGQWGFQCAGHDFTALAKQTAKRELGEFSDHDKRRIEEISVRFSSLINGR